MGVLRKLFVIIVFLLLIGMIEIINMKQLMMF